jgi:hypothetical protein
MRVSTTRTLIAAAILSFSFAANATDIKDIAPSPIVIADDHGGSIDQFLMWYGRVRAAHVPVVLRGVCESACTFVLSLPREQVCVEDTASLGFHLATVNGKNEPELTGTLIRRWYPESVRRWLSTRKLRTAPTYMTAKEIVELGIFAKCPVTKPVPDFKLGSDDDEDESDE